MTAALLGLLLSFAAAAHAGTVSGVLTLRGAATGGAVVYLESLAGPVPSTPGRAVMDQKALAFVPRVLPVTAGTTVEFTNSDEIDHNVFTPSRAAGAVDLGSYHRGETRSVTMREVGDVVVLCNIHMEMEAHILVVRDPFFAVTDAGGRYRIADVPPGRYTVKVWRRTWQPVNQILEVAGDAPVALDLTVPRP